MEIGFYSNVERTYSQGITAEVAGSNDGPVVTVIDDMRPPEPWRVELWRQLLEMPEPTPERVVQWVDQAIRCVRCRRAWERWIEAYPPKFGPSFRGWAEVAIVVIGCNGWR